MVCFFWLRPCLDQIMPRSSQITCPGWSKYSKSKFQTDHQIPWIFQSFDQSFQSLQGQTEKRVAALAGSWLLWKDITTTKANFSPFPHGFTFFFTTRSYTSYHIIRIVSVLTGPPYWLSMIIVIQADQKKTTPSLPILLQQTLNLFFQRFQSSSCLLGGFNPVNNFQPFRHWRKTAHFAGCFLLGKLTNIHITLKHQTGLQFSNWDCNYVNHHKMG